MKKTTAILSTAVAIALTACDVHQFPEPAEERLHVVLDLDFSTELPLYTVMEYPDGTNPDNQGKSRAADDYSVRHTVQIFAGTDASSRATVSRAGADYTTTVVRPIGQTLDTEIEVEIPDGPYTAMVWTDYVHTASGNAFHIPDDFADISIADIPNYRGSTDLRDAFRGQAEFFVPDPDRIADRRETVHIAMERPKAKFTIIATDVRQFISRAKSRNAQAAPTEDSRAFDFNDYSARLVYTGYLPSSFNMFLNKPVDSTTGVWFDSRIHPLSDDEARLAFDYVMVNGSEAKVDAALQILDREGKIVAQSSVMRIPMMRSKHTEIRGKFLTASNSSGVSIVTKFDGEYNIEIR